METYRSKTRARWGHRRERRSYQSVETLTRTVQGYINALANWQGARWGGVRGITG